MKITGESLLTRLPEIIESTAGVDRVIRGLIGTYIYKICTTIYDPNRREDSKTLFSTISSISSVPSVQTRHKDGISIAPSSSTVSALRSSDYLYGLS